MNQEGVQEALNSRYGKSYAIGLCISPLLVFCLVAMNGVPLYQEVILTVVAYIVSVQVYAVTVLQRSEIPRATRYWTLFLIQVVLIGLYITWSSHSSPGLQP